MPISQSKIELSPVAFWDVAFDQIDVDADSQFVLSKVFNYGLWADMVAVMSYYGLDRVKREIVRAAYLKNTVISFLCVVLDLREDDFIAYQQRQERKPIWTN
ncbi:MAG: hypothetical protein EOO39_04835 [Cytophagaceae bacterium]|nr:MAG: hypothetical protein EOO39_04835 [Cytophagaceae bacterium]